MIASRVQPPPKIQYDYFNKGNFSLPKDTKDSKQQIKPIPGLPQDVVISINNLKKIFPNKIADFLAKDKDKIQIFNQSPFAFSKNTQFLAQNQPLTPFQSLLLVKVLKPQQTVEAINIFIKQVLGEDFVDSSSPSMQNIYNDTMNKIPLVFILSVGADPLQNLLRFSKEKGKKAEDITIISLGQGQGPPALKALEISTKEGKWVILQNCHLGKSFLPTLQKKLEEINQSQQINQDFRLFITCMPCDYFPISILQNSLKVTSEPPQGIKSNLKKLMGNVTWGQTDEQKTFSFNLCLFHSIVLERRKFGSLGWNILYDFNESDLQTSLTIVSNLVTSYDDIPYEAIQYFVGEIVYGGRVTDEFDRRLLKTQLLDYISFENIEKPKVKATDVAGYLSHIDKLSQNDDPNMFGLNQNAQKTYLMKITAEALECIMMLEPQQAAIGGKADRTTTLINQILLKIPAVIKKAEDRKNIDAVDICILQQSVRFNKLIMFIEKTLKELLLAIKGEAIMTQMLEKILISLTINQVPKQWEKRAYPSMKPLSSWFEDFLERVKFMRQAVIEKPRIYWISAFFFPQGFLTSILQIFARKMKFPVDSLGFSFVFKQQAEKQFTEGSPLDGCLIYGLTSQACCIDFKSSILKQSPPNVLDCDVPVIHFKPIQTAKQQINYTHYNCPLYKTKKRAGTLSTTGHSTNYIISVICKSEQEQSFWIKRGAAFFCALQK